MKPTPGTCRALTYLILANSDSPQLRYRHLTIFNISRSNRPINEHTKKGSNKVRVCYGGADKQLRCAMISKISNIFFQLQLPRFCDENMICELRAWSDSEKVSSE